VSRLHPFDVVSAGLPEDWFAEVRATETHGRNPSDRRQFHELAPNHFFTSRQRIESCRVIGFAQDVLPFLVLMHAEKNFPEALHDRFRNILAH